MCILLMVSLKEALQIKLKASDEPVMARPGTGDKASSGLDESRSMAAH